MACAFSRVRMRVTDVRCLMSEVLSICVAIVDSRPRGSVPTALPAAVRQADRGVRKRGREPHSRISTLPRRADCDILFAFCRKTAGWPADGGTKVLKGRPLRFSRKQKETSMLDEMRAKRDEIYAIARRHKAEKLRVFGSCAIREVLA